MAQTPLHAPRHAQVALPAESCDLAPTKYNGLKWTYHASDHSVSTKLTGAKKGSLCLRKGVPASGCAGIAYGRAGHVAHAPHMGMTAVSGFACIGLRRFVGLTWASCKSPQLH